MAALALNLHPRRHPGEGRDPEPHTRPAELDPLGPGLRRDDGGERKGFWGSTTTLACTIEIEHSDESLHAHVALDGDPVIGPGDRVRVHGAPIRVAFGEKLRVRRAATLERAGALTRLWTRFAGHFGMAELYEVSFSPGRIGR